MSQFVGANTAHFKQRYLGDSLFMQNVSFCVPSPLPDMGIAFQ